MWHLLCWVTKKSPDPETITDVGKRRWTSATDIGDPLGPVPGDALGYRTRLRYLLIDTAAEFLRRVQGT
ncbi:MAG: hypothetical protein F4106_13445 [Gemmatimonadetes bacterium]|nr:hypothetical protein [Gemmatimonadota bacterium]